MDAKAKAQEQAQAQAQALLKSINDDKVAEINGREYRLLNFTHKNRVKVWAYFSSVNLLIETGNFSFLDSDKFKEVEAVIFANVAYKNGKLDDEHFEKYPNDYIKFITTFLGAISYPFFAESLTN